ncbi:MAG: DEAD/DEAH box helicase [Lachnospiraceae bacterium]|nr:DEAD/DEAH box helicase [Lachnospiraceae bacterium]
MRGVMRMYVADIIKDEYKEWKENEKIFITAPTGCGKSSFIINDLFEYACLEKKYILYLVNRKILKKQLENDILDKVKSMPSDDSYQKYITVKTYQEIESEMMRGTICYYQYRYIVCDEVHYFISDSMFNTNTIKSYKYIQSYYQRATVIFMSATMDIVKSSIKVIETGYDEKLHGKGGNSLTDDCKYKIDSYNKTVKEYYVEQNYDYLDIVWFKSIDDIPTIIEDADMISDSKVKWLIFLNNIEKAKEIERQIEENKTVVFIKSNYEKDDDAKENVDLIISTKEFKADVLISTSVLDNGISIEDEELRNIVIVTDDKTELLQMLGRKRKDGQNVNVFLWTGNEEHFKHRYEWYNEIYNKYLSINYMVEESNRARQMWANNVYPYSQTQFGEIQGTEKISEPKNYQVDNQQHHIDLGSMLPDSVRLNNKKNNQINEIHSRNTEMHSMFPVGVPNLACWNQIEIMNQFLGSERMHNVMKHFIFQANWCGNRTYFGIELGVNPFSGWMINDKYSLAKEIMETIEKDGYAFCKRQLEWLGLLNEEVVIDVYNNEKVIEETKKIICELVEQELGKELDQEMNVAFKLKIFTPAMRLLKLLGRHEKKELNKWYNTLRKPISPNGKISEACISANKFTELMEIFQLPYVMCGGNKTGIYVVESKDLY